MTTIKQTQQAIEALKACGFSRKQFNVRTPCHRGEYQDTQILLMAPKETQLAALKSMADHGLAVTVYTVPSKDHTSYPTLSLAAGRGSYTIIDIDAHRITEEYHAL